MKVLSIEQMNKLKELGVDVKPKEECLMYSSVGGDDYKLMYGQSVCEDDMRAFRFDDIIELLPKTLNIPFVSSKLIIEEKSILYAQFKGLYIRFIDHIEFVKKDGLLDAAYQMLIWVIENGYLKTK